MGKAKACEIKTGSKPYRLFCNIPLGQWPDLIDILPVIIATMVQDDEIISQGRGFAVAGSFFHIFLEENNTERYVIVRDVSREEFCKPGSYAIRPLAVDEMISYFESKRLGNRN